MKQVRSMLAGSLAVLVLAGSVPVAAQGDVTPKEEVVYVNLKDDGSVKDITVVNAFTLDADGEIVDYGRYDSVRNMTTTDKIGYADGKVTIHAQAGKLYYEGTLSDVALPWTIAVRYTLDGKDYTADEVAGKSGHLKIFLDITKNKEGDSRFFEGYALQTTLTLDTATCENIVADNATVANVGSDKQLSYILLPGKESHLVVQADVTDFEMEGIAINGVKLNLSLSVDKTKLQDKIDELTGAVVDLDEGASKLNDGASEVGDASAALATGAGKLKNGAGQLKSGAEQLASGLSTVDGKSQTLVDGAYAAFEGLCEAASAAINAQLKDSGAQTITLTPDNYAMVLKGLLAQVNADKAYEQAYAQAKQQVTAAVEAQADTLYAGYIQQHADEIVDAYLQSQAEELYTAVAKQAVAEQLAAAGMTDEQIATYWQTAEGQALVEQTKAMMTDEQKAQIVAAAKASLTDEQRQQILQAAQAALTDEQKAAIKDGYIQQQMADDTVTEQIRAAVDRVDTAAGEIAALKGQLDQYAVFYQGVQEYTAAVGSAAKGAAALAKGLDSLFDNAGTLASGAATLNEAVQSLVGGTKELNDGTAQFRDKTKGLSGEVDDVIETLVDEATGKGTDTGSFVSAQNDQVQSVQFVMKTEGVTKTETQPETPTTTETLTF